MIHHFRLIPFLAGLALGWLMLKYYQAPAKVVFEYPHPDNVKQRVYRDTNGICYRYTSEKVDCDANEATLKPYPIQG